MEEIIKDLTNGDNENILIKDFEDYLEENNYNISKIFILNEQYINNYINSLNYDIVDNVENYREQKEIEEKIYEILDKYCCETINNKGD